MKQLSALIVLMCAAACDNSPKVVDASPKPADKAAEYTSNEVATSRSDSRKIGAVRNLTGETSSLTGMVSDFSVERTDFGTRVQLTADTLFEFDKETLVQTAHANLRRMAELVRQGGAGIVTIIGHSDAKGEEGYNLDLSKRRAEAVAAWLRAQPGMNDRIFAVAARGEAEPIAPNIKPDGTDNPEGRARNRRVTVDIPE